MYEPFVEQCVIRPLYAHLQRAYKDYESNSRPCRKPIEGAPQGATNQCAIRMSMALVRAGFGLESFRPANRVHSGSGQCGTGNIPHVLGAEELANFLTRHLFSPRVFAAGRRHSGCASALDQIRGTTGILYFNNCFMRHGERTKKGDHIDLFDGTQYYNQILHPAAAGDERRRSNLFRDADQVRFWALS